MPSSRSDGRGAAARRARSSLSASSTWRRAPRPASARWPCPVARRPGSGGCLSAIRRCWALSWRLRSIRRRSACPASRMRSREVSQLALERAVLDGEERGRGGGAHELRDPRGAPRRSPAPPSGGRCGRPAPTPAPSPPAAARAPGRRPRGTPRRPDPSSRSQGRIVQRRGHAVVPLPGVGRAASRSISVRRPRAANSSACRSAARKPSGSSTRQPSEHPAERLEARRGDAERPRARSGRRRTRAGRAATSRRPRAGPGAAGAWRAPKPHGVDEHDAAVAARPR